MGGKERESRIKLAVKGCVREGRGSGLKIGGDRVLQGGERESSIKLAVIGCFREGSGLKIGSTRDSERGAREEKRH